ncbi:MAG: HAD-IA family hydrolase [Deinococcota bacterium]
MIEVVFCDLDGVIRHWDNTQLYDLERAHSLSQGFTFQHAFQPELLLPAITGQISDETWREQVRDKLAKTVSTKIAKVLMDAWLSSPFTLDVGWLETLREYFPKAPIVVVTNAKMALEASLTATPVHDYVDDIINSSDIAVAKPDPEFYNYALTQYQLAAPNALFIDDSAQNCEVAASLGFCRLHFTTKQHALAQLATHKDD